PVGRRCQPSPRFFHILRNSLPEQIARSQPKLATGIILIGRLSVPVEGLRIVQPSELLIYEDIAQFHLGRCVAQIGGSLEPADGSIDIPAMLRPQVPPRQFEERRN